MPFPPCALHAVEAEFGARRPAHPVFRQSARPPWPRALPGWLTGNTRSAAERSKPVTVEDALTGKMTVLNPVSTPVAEVLSAASALAREISPHITPYGTRESLVVEAHVEALEGLDQPGVADSLEKAIAADPNFGPNYRQLAQIKAQQNDVAGALALLDGHWPAGAPSRTPNGRSSSCRPPLYATTLPRACGRSPLSPRPIPTTRRRGTIWPRLPSPSTNTRRRSRRIKRRSPLSPTMPILWNQLAYAAAYAGDACGRHRRGEALPEVGCRRTPIRSDTLGDVNLITGHLAEAEDDYRQSAKKSPEFLAGLDLLKAAMAHLMTGDVAGADTLAQQYFAARAPPRIRWWTTARRNGRGSAAAARPRARRWSSWRGARKPAGRRNVAAHAMPSWPCGLLMLGDRAAASEMARKAAALGHSRRPPSRSRWRDFWRSLRLRPPSGRRAPMSLVPTPRRRPSAIPGASRRAAGSPRNMPPRSRSSGNNRTSWPGPLPYG
jgi:hypothetical protein